MDGGGVADGLSSAGSSGKEAARKADPAADAARRELDDALRSLGLQRGQLQQNAVKKDYDARSARGLSRPGAAGISGAAAGLQPGRLACRGQRMASKNERAMSHTTFRDIWCRFIPSGFRTTLPTC